MDGLAQVATPTAGQPLMTPDEYCQDKAAQSGSSFYYAFRLLPADRRRAITAFYAFCREVDNIVDEVSDVDVALSKLAYWRREIDNLYAGQPQHPVTQALSPHIAPLHLPQTALHTVVTACSRISTNPLSQFRRLASYCYKAAGVVGEVSARIFGIARTNNPATPRIRSHAGRSATTHQYHSRCRRGRAAQSHLPAAGRSGSVWGVIVVAAAWPAER